MNRKNVVGRVIRSRRLDQGLSLRKLAARVEISPTYLSHIEAEIVPPPSAEVLSRLASTLEIDGGRLLAKGHRLSESVVSKLERSTNAKRLFELVLAMEEGELEQLVSEIESRNVDHELGGLLTFP